MPKELLIMRHAKSSWENNSLSDHERPLNARGLRDAPRMARHLNSRNTIPDLIVTSSATRARTTAMLMSEHLNTAEVQVEVVDDFYLAPPSIYIEYVQRLSDQYVRPLFVGHNPGLESLVNQLNSGQFQSMPTAAIAHAQFEFDMWNMLIDIGSADSLSVFRPKELNDYVE